MNPLDDQQQAARSWFESLRDRICAEFEAIEREAGSAAAFVFTPWDRTEEDGSPGGGGVRGQMAGTVFEKVGVNVSTVGGRFSPEFAASIPGTEDDPSFFATGISLVAHMANPHVPAVHMNTRFLTTGKRWFGGGADLNPALPIQEDTDAFHARLRAACAAHDPTFYPRFSKWAEEYFWLPHRKVARGVGGIFYDRLEGHFDAHFAFTRDVGEAFLDIFPAIVRRRMDQPFGETERQALLDYRGRYVEFNLLFDRGTLFGLKTGGNIDAILMSLPAGALGMSLEPLRDGELAAVVTYLEMTADPARPVPPSALRLERRQPTPEEHRALFRSVGGPWLWFSRLAMSDAALAALLGDERVESFAVVDTDDREVGLVELDFRDRDQAELSFLGLLPDWAGKGHGRWLLAETVRRAWLRPIGRLTVHTCSLDHPAALSAYRRAGFTPFKRAIERFADPRLAGLLPPDVAPHVPLMGTPPAVARCA